MSADLVETPISAGEAARLVEPAASPSARRRGARAGIAVWGPPLLVFFGFIALWYFVSYVILDARLRANFVPPPDEVIRVAFLDSDNFKELLSSLERTTLVAFTGLALAIVIGVAAAVVMSQAVWLERSFFPYWVMLQCIPIVALVPLFGLWLGFAFKARVLVCVLIGLFPIINNTLFGLLSVDRGLHDLFTLHNRGRLTRLLKLQFPAAMPSIFSGLRIGAGASVIGAIVGDIFFKQGQPGIGILIDLYRSRLQTPQLFGAVIVASMLGIAVFLMFGLLSKLVVGSWHESGRGTS